jgi:excisionase family DNA binding protein
VSRGKNRKPVCAANRSIPRTSGVGHNQQLEPIDPAPPGFEQLLTAAQAAVILNMSLRKVRRLIENKILPAVRIGRAVRIRPEDLRTFIERCLKGKA